MGCCASEEVDIDIVKMILNKHKFKYCIRYKCPICHRGTMRYAKENQFFIKRGECVVCTDEDAIGQCCCTCKVPLCSRCALDISTNEINNTNNLSLKRQ